MRNGRFHLVLLGCLASTFSLAAQQPVFEKDVAPILIERCLDCHSGLAPKGKLDLTTRKNALQGGKSGPALTPKELDASELWVRVAADEMPPKKPLSAREKDVLKRWIEQGGDWPGEPLDIFSRTSESRAGFDWWALRGLQLKQPLQLPNSTWARNEIDLFLQAELTKKGLTPSPEADRRTLIRRLTFDLIGLPPTPAEVDAFVNDPRPDAYERLADRLLASPQYGERWARHWLDVVRFGESHGFEHDELRKNAWPYRDWVIQALNADMPYDEFAKKQVAGDILYPTDPGSIPATGFLVAGGYDSVGQVQQSPVMRAVVRGDEMEDIVGTLGQTFLGLTVQCARCHDHKFDPIRTEEYYQLWSALDGVRHGERDVTSPEVLKQHALAKAHRELRIVQLERQLRELEAPVREKILAERGKKADPNAGSPAPFARWDFTQSLKDQVGSLHAELKGNAERTERGLILDGKAGHAVTGMLSKSLTARTLSAWVQLANLEQRGGAALSIQTPNGGVFDAIVFAERDAGQWLSGSNFFQRTAPFQGPAETEAATKPIHVAITYHDDGTITGYRNGKLYGKAYKPSTPATFKAGETQILFGLRHSPPGGNRHLKGTILKAEIFDRALAPEELAAVAGDASTYVREDDLLARMSADQKAKRKELSEQLAQARQPLLEPSRTKVYAVTPREPQVIHVLLRGEPGRIGPEVKPGGLRAVAGTLPNFGLASHGTDADRRRNLANWIVQGPLFARVMVNRLWHHHFGVGIVDTPSDFGFNGGRPSHPELLEWLADRFQKEKYSLKKMHRTMVLSAAYRQASRYRPEAAKLDAGNRLLWRKSPTRLEAEAVRDAILSVAGVLNPQMGGPGYEDFKMFKRGGTHYYPPIDDDTPGLNRRSIYRTWVRSGRNPLLDVLDCPDPSTVTPRRAVTTTPLQALSLLNGPFLLRTADHFAKRLEKEAAGDRTKQIEHAYLLAMGRPAAPEEVRAASALVERHGLRALTRAILNSNEFVYVD